MASARGTATTAPVAIVLVLLGLSLLVELGIARSSGRWRGGRAHGKVRESGLVTTVRVLTGLVRRNIELLSLLLRELESIYLGVDTTHVATLLESVNLAQLLGLQQSHVYVLLVCSCNLLLLLLKQLNLLLNGQLFHCRHATIISFLTQLGGDEGVTWEITYSLKESAQRDFSGERYGACAQRGLAPQTGRLVDP